ncbi:Uncharacterized protein dnm_033780 [Desulfonema magnum]|uniref:Uncharacterized protein n=1 Tax=Desulfonema magnum TaxID=45655 RepID=A0A975BKU3_9BACT|nr:Uncharacterized protein dnm_033780 [Desulfonema magnum]
MLNNITIASKSKPRKVRSSAFRACLKNDKYPRKRAWRFFF